LNTTLGEDDREEKSICGARHEKLDRFIVATKKVFITKYHLQSAIDS
jgi:hypothetical protein